jgi:hypothetical protein
MTLLKEMADAINCEANTGDPCNICDDARRHLAAVRELVEAAGGIEICTDADRYNRLLAALAPFIAGDDGVEGNERHDSGSGS